MIVTLILYHNIGSLYPKRENENETEAEIDLKLKLETEDRSLKTEAETGTLGSLKRCIIKLIIKKSQREEQQQQLSLRDAFKRCHSD